MKFTIRHRFTNDILFEAEAKSFVKAIGAANKKKANLRGANLRGADLRGADLRWADLCEAKGIQAERCTPLFLLLEQPGPIRAYKLVNKKSEDPFNGGIKYEVGGSYAVTDANTDVNERCSRGINVSTLDWCLREWREGYRVLIVEFTAAEIAAIPTATDGKFRLRACRVVGEKDISHLVELEKEPPCRED